MSGNATFATARFRFATAATRMSASSTRPARAGTPVCCSSTVATLMTSSRPIRLLLPAARPSGRARTAARARAGSSTAASANTTSTVWSVPSGAAACDTFKLVGSMYGHCATPQPMTTVATAPIDRTRAPRASRTSSSERADAADRRQDDERQRARREAVEHVAGVAVEHEDARRTRRRRRRRRRRSPARRKYSRHRLRRRGGARPSTRYTADEVGAHGDREDAAEDRRRVDPTRPRIARLAAGRHTPGRDRAGHRAHAVRHEHRRRCERGTEVALVAGAEHGLAEREARARGARCPSAANVNGTNKRQRDRRERLGERGPQHDEREDQPDVVRLPHRADRVVDDGTRAFAARPRRRRSRSQNPAPKSAPPNTA